eukprot:168227_1
MTVYNNMPPKKTIALIAFICCGCVIVVGSVDFIIALIAFIIVVILITMAFVYVAWKRKQLYYQPIINKDQQRRIQDWLQEQLDPTNLYVQIPQNDAELQSMQSLKREKDKSELCTEELFDNFIAHNCTIKPDEMHNRKHNGHKTFKNIIAHSTHDKQLLLNPANWNIINDCIYQNMNEKKNHKKIDKINK